MVEKVAPRSYLLQTSNGQQLRRNRRHIRLSLGDTPAACPHHRCSCLPVDSKPAYPARDAPLYIGGQPPLPLQPATQPQSAPRPVSSASSPAPLCPPQSPGGVSFNQPSGEPPSPPPREPHAPNITRSGRVKFHRPSSCGGINNHRQNVRMHRGKETTRANLNSESNLSPSKPQGRKHSDFIYPLMSSSPPQKSPNKQRDNSLPLDNRLESSRSRR